MQNTEKSNRQRVKDVKRTLKSTSSLHRLDSFLDDKGILRVGGRLQRAEFSSNRRHPANLPKNYHTDNSALSRKDRTPRAWNDNKLRANGFWVIGCSNTVSQYIEYVSNAEGYAMMFKSRRWQIYLKIEFQRLLPSHTEGWTCLDPGL